MRPDVEAQLTQKELLDQFLEHWFKSAGGESFTGAFHSFEDLEQLDELVGGHLRKLVMKRLEIDEH